MNKQEYIEQGRQNYKAGGDPFEPAVSWQQRAHNQGWDEAHEEWRVRNPAPATPLVKTGESSGQIGGRAWSPNMPKPATLGRGVTTPQIRVLDDAGESSENLTVLHVDYASATGVGSFISDATAVVLGAGWPAISRVTHALESLTDVRGDSQHALRSHAWALIARAHVVAGQGNTARADDLTEKARRIVSHLLGREL